MTDLESVVGIETVSDCVCNVISFVTLGVGTEEGDEFVGVGWCT